MLRDGVMIMIALMFGGCFGVVVTCCMVTAKRSDQELGDMMKEKREGTVMQKGARSPPESGIPRRNPAFFL